MPVHALTAPSNAGRSRSHTVLREPRRIGQVDSFGDSSIAAPVRADHRFGDYSLTPQPARSAESPVQLKRGFLGGIKHALGIGYDWKKEHQDRRQVGEDSGLITHAIHRGGVGVDYQPFIDEADYPAPALAARKAMLDSRTAVTGLASAGKIGVAAASAAKDTTGLVAPILGTAAGPLGVIGGAVDMTLKAQQIKSGAEKAGDKALLGTSMLSDLGSATAAGASTVNGVAGWLPSAGLMSSGGAKALSAGAVSVAGPAALAMGGVDVLTGGIGAGLAEHRRRRLENMENMHGAYDESAVLKMAKEAQKTKRNRNLGTVLKGGLGLAAGGALVAGALGATAATPVGWGLLAGAGLVGLGVLGYRQWRKHREGTRILKDHSERAKLARLGVATPTEHELAQESRWRRWNPFNTKESRAHDLIRSSVAGVINDKLHDPHRSEMQTHDEENVPLTAMVSHLGLKSTGPKKARKSDIARALEG